MPKIQFIISDVSAVTFSSLPTESSEVPMIRDFCQYYSASSCLMYLIGMLRTDNETVPSVNNIKDVHAVIEVVDRRGLFNHLFWLLLFILILFQILMQKVYTLLSRLCEISL